MRLSALVLPVLLASATASLAQTGFTTKIYPAAGDTTLRVADFNHDGKPDLLGYNTFFNVGNIYLNDGNGGFKAPVALPQNNTGTIMYAQIADMNSDGFPDIVACTEQTGRTSGSFYLVIYLNDGTGNFTIGQITTLAYGCNTLIVGDVNLDGHPDVVIASYTNASPTSPANNIFQTFLGDGAGNVGASITQQNVDLDSPDASNSFTNCGVINITGGNFFLDGQFSLIANTTCKPIGQTNPSNLGTTFLGHGYGTGQYTFTESHKGDEYLTDGQTADVNQDGKPDATFYSVTGQPYSNLYYAQNNGSGSFTYNQLTGDIIAAKDPTPVQFTGKAVADFTGDGINDIASIFTTVTPTNSAQNVVPYISILAGSANGAFVESQHWIVDPNSTGVGDMVSADFNGDGKADLAVLVLDGPYPSSTTSLYVYTNTMASNTSCNAPTAANTNIICEPAQGSTVSGSPFTVTAASNVTGFTLNRLYLDNTAVYQTTSQTINTPITAATGNHDLVLVSYDNSGKAFTTSTTFTVGSGNGECLPSGPGVNICQPGQNATADSPVTLTAGAIAQSGDITALRFYVDNVAVYTADNSAKSTSFQATQAVPLSAGSHHLVVVGYESTGGSLTFAENFTVAASTNCYPSSAGAMICSPIKNATVSSPVQVSAGATAGSGYITALAMYVDNVEENLAPDPYPYKSFSTIQSLTLSKGTHNLVVVGYQSTGGAVTASETITVQ